MRYDQEVQFSFPPKNIFAPPAPEERVPPPIDEADLAFRSGVFAPILSILSHLSMTSYLFGEHFDVDPRPTWRWQQITPDQSGKSQSLSLRTDSQGAVFVYHEGIKSLNLPLLGVLRTPITLKVKTNDLEETLATLGEIFAREQVKEAYNAYLKSRTSSGT